jgi:hypothetical protein
MISFSKFFNVIGFQTNGVSSRVDLTRAVYEAIMLLICGKENAM